MKKVFTKTKNKIQELWNAVAELNGKFGEIEEKISNLDSSTEGAWKELNRPKTVIRGFSKNSGLITNVSQDSVGHYMTITHNLETESLIIIFTLSYTYSIAGISHDVILHNLLSIRDVILDVNTIKSYLVLNSIGFTYYNFSGIYSVIG